MRLTIFLGLQFLSVLVAYFSTRSTFRYLSKHQVVPQQRYMLFRVVRLRHIGLAYLSIVVLICLYSYAYGLFVYHG